MQITLHETPVRKERRRRLLTLSIALATLPLLGEGMTRLLAPQRLVRPFYVADIELGYRLRPDGRYMDRSEYYRYDVVTNAEGLRMDAQVRHSGDTLRILALGDSFTFGWGVEYQESFVSRLEQALTADEPAIQLLNAGVGGYSTGHVHKLLTHRAGPLAPCAAIYFLNPNDIADNLLTDPSYRVTSYRPDGDGSFSLTDERVYAAVPRGVATSAAYGWLNRRSHLFRLLKQASRAAVSTDSVGAGAPMSAAEADRAIRVTEAHVRRLLSLADSLELPLLVIAIPDWKELFPAENADETYPELKRRLSIALTDAFYDPVGFLRREIARESVGIARLYFADGAPVGHFTPAGHALFARSTETAVAEFVEQACRTPHEFRH